MSKLSVKALNPPCVEYLKELGERLLDSDTMSGNSSNDAISCIIYKCIVAS